MKHSVKTANVTEFDLSAPHLQVPDQTRPPLPGTQSGRQQQEVQRRALREPQVRYAGQHPSVRDKKKTNVLSKHCRQHTLKREEEIRKW